MWKNTGRYYFFYKSQNVFLYNASCGFIKSKKTAIYLSENDAHWYHERTHVLCKPESISIKLGFDLEKKKSITIFVTKITLTNDS